MTFVRSKNISSQMITCPNCGASNQLVTSGKCEYCDTKNNYLQEWYLIDYEN